MCIRDRGIGIRFCVNSLAPRDKRFIVVRAGVADGVFRVAVGQIVARLTRITFDGFLKTIATYSNNNKVYTYNYETDAMNTPANSVAMFDDLWKNAEMCIRDRSNTLSPINRKASPSCA